MRYVALNMTLKLSANLLNESTKASQNQKQMCLQKCQIKPVLITFCGSKGIIHK